MPLGETVKAEVGNGEVAIIPSGCVPKVQFDLSRLIAVLNDPNAFGLGLDRHNGSVYG